jgi:hypothetical protein
VVSIAAFLGEKSFGQFGFFFFNLSNLKEEREKENPSRNGHFKESHWHTWHHTTSGTAV